MEACNITAALVEIRQAFAGGGYKPQYIRELNRVWDRFETFARERDLKVLDSTTIEAFLGYYRAVLGLTIRADVQRAINALTDYCNFGQKLKRTKLAYANWSGPFETQFATYFTHYETLGHSGSSNHAVQRHLKTFQKYLATMGVKSLEDVDSKHLYGLLENHYASTQKKWKCQVLRDIRRFLEYLHTQGIAVKVFSHAYPTVRVYEDSDGIPNVFTKEEVNGLLSAVDRGGPMGKRDYAVMLLSARYGLRACDIVNLRFENLDWRENAIRLIQSKTGKELTLPLLPDVGWAVIDYLDHGRPVSPHPQIFVSHKAPHEPFTSSLNHLIAKYMSLAKIPAQKNRTPGFHAIRHAVASEMLRENIPLSSIKEVLGQDSIHTTAKYQRIEMTQLALCALEVPDVSA